MGGAFSSHENIKRTDSKLILAQDAVVNKILTEDDEDEEEQETSGEDITEATATPVKRRFSRCLSFEIDRTYRQAMETDAADFEYPFENLVFGGGGARGFTYCGACSVLEDSGILKNIKRFSGSSIGAFSAAFYAMGYTTKEVAALFGPEFVHMVHTHRFGYFSLIPNLLRGYGWNSFSRIYKWLGDTYEAKTGNPDITFYELYKKYGRELCVVVTNLNMMREEYFHPKTTPDVPIRLAVRMSCTFPGLIQPIKFHRNGYENTYVDGGLLCSYPIHSFDGWWLSMKPEDRFLKRLQPVQEYLKMYSHEQRFDKPNPKTIGLKIYSDDDDLLDRSQLDRLTPLDQDQPIPDTTYGRKYMKQEHLERKTLEKQTQILNAVDAFLKTLEKYNSSDDGTINKEDLVKTFQDEESFPKRYATRLFGENVSVDDVFSAMDRDSNGKIQVDEIHYFIERTGVNMASRVFGHRWTEVGNAWNFVVQIQLSLLMNMNDRTFKHHDLERTVGINTGYLKTTDFQLEHGDIDYLYEEGRRRMDAFLRHYAVVNNLKNKYTPSERLVSVEETHEI